MNFDYVCGLFIRLKYVRIYQLRQHLEEFNILLGLLNDV